MLSAKTLLSLILFALTSVGAKLLSRSGNGKSTILINRKFKLNGINFAENERVRFQNLKSLGGNGGSFNVTNVLQGYTTVVGIGSPPTNYTLIIDTGSSNTWIGGGKSYTQTCTSKDTGNTISVTYGTGGFSGEEWIDTVALSPDLVIVNQSIGVANVSNGIAPLDGILGLGPVDMTAGTVTNTSLVPTVSDNLYSQGTISQEVLGVYFAPASESDNDGTLTFGGIDNSVNTSEVAYAPLTLTLPASYYWGINQSMTYDNETILSPSAGIVDTGTTLILINTDAFQKYQIATGGVLDLNTGLLTITSEQYSNLKPLSFNIGGESYALIPNAQIWPRSLNTAIGGNSASIYLIVLSSGLLPGSGFDFVIGYTFLERFYSVFDTTNQRIGFATTNYTNSTSN